MPAPATLLELAKPAPVKPALLLSIAPFTAQNPAWFSSIKMLTFAAEEEPDGMEREEEMTAEDLTTDAAVDEATDERIGVDVDDDDLEEVTGTTLDVTDDTALLHKLPVMMGTSAEPPFFSTCTPNVAL